MKYFLRSFSSLPLNHSRRVVVSYKRKYVHEVLGPISSTSLRPVFVLKTSYEVRTLKIGFHQIIELCELLTFCRLFKTNI